MRCVSSDGRVVVEVIRRTASAGRDGEWIRIRRGGFHYADVRSVAELTRHLASLGLGLADLTET
jgi:hypothetical protein